MESVLTYIKNGGVFMYPIIIGAVWALMLLFERFIFYMQTASRLTRQSEIFFKALHSGGVDEARKYLETQKSVMVTVLSNALENRDLPVERIEEKIETILIRDLPIYGRYFNLIATLAGLMPILGLLGTVTGMIGTFNVIALSGTGDAKAMADGISEALITTQAGLVAALPLILGHSLLSTRLQRITEKIKSSCAQLIDYLKDNHA
jgi:biopolymer transport protein ExbB